MLQYGAAFDGGKKPPTLGGSPRHFGAGRGSTATARQRSRRPAMRAEGAGTQMDMSAHLWALGFRLGPRTAPRRSGAPPRLLARRSAQPRRATGGRTRPAQRRGGQPPRTDAAHRHQQAAPHAVCAAGFGAAAPARGAPRGGPPAATKPSSTKRGGWGHRGARHTDGAAAPRGGNPPRPGGASEPNGTQRVQYVVGRTRACASARHGAPAARAHQGLKERAARHPAQGRSGAAPRASIRRCGARTGPRKTLQGCTMYDSLRGPLHRGETRRRSTPTHHAPPRSRALRALRRGRARGRRARGRCRRSTAMHDEPPRGGPIGPRRGGGGRDGGGAADAAGIT